MEMLGFCRNVFGAGVIAGFLLACGGNVSIAPVTRASANRALADTSPGYKELYRFKAGHDGYAPVPGLTYLNGTYYGTTVFGGAYGRGTIFSATSSGKEHVIHSFGGNPDCALPFGVLLNVNGTLYGTCLGGGAHANGCVFTVTPSGKEKVIYSFQSYGGGDGASPHSDLLEVNRTLYGTTESGGANDKGTVFKITPSGNEEVIYSFKGGKDGDTPYAGLVGIKGTLYGTTTDSAVGDSLWGTVFSITTSGIEKVLYNFKGPPDGADPFADLVVMNGTLYGTTKDGGSAGWGTVFSVTSSGKEKVLHSFKGFTDGQYPYAPLVAFNGSLYGTTSSGGRNSHCSYFGCGTVYGITASGTEKVIYTFRDDPDGANPAAGLLAQGKVLYGTTTGGGYGYGTVFQIAP